MAQTERAPRTIPDLFTTVPSGAGYVPCAAQCGRYLRRSRPAVAYCPPCTPRPTRPRPVEDEYAA